MNESEESQFTWLATGEGSVLKVGRTGVVVDVLEDAAGNLFSEACFARLDSTYLSEISRCSSWFKQAKKSSTASVNSFWLQQFLQHWSGEKLSQGAVILAAHESGFEIRQLESSRTGSVSIGLATECIDQFDCGCGHP